MLKFLPRPLLGTLMAMLFVLNLLIWAVPVYALILAKVFTPKGALRDRITRGMGALAQGWMNANIHISDSLLGTRWDIQGVDGVHADGQYIIAANHQTWNDIMVLLKAFQGRAPFFKFFLKKELIWVPLLGPVWWALEYPFMQRHGREAIRANPDLARQDLEATRKACDSAREQPIMLLNFLEGTRFTPEKHDNQNSPYRYLLRPKTGALVLALQAIGEKLSTVLDVTIFYPDGACGFWDFLGGRMKRVIVRVREISVPPEFHIGDYIGDHDFRERVQAWVSRIWDEKDALIAQLQAQHA